MTELVMVVPHHLIHMKIQCIIDHQNGNGFRPLCHVWVPKQISVCVVKSPHTRWHLNRISQQWHCPEANGMPELINRNFPSPNFPIHDFLTIPKLTESEMCVIKSQPVVLQRVLFCAMIFGGTFRRTSDANPCMVIQWFQLQQVIQMLKTPHGQHLPDQSASK